jgi:Ser/Thr protein kinase RdoA (MazF antagonist)
MIRGDMFDDNIIYHQGRLQAIIDFGDTCYYPRAYDLGSVLFGAWMRDGALNLEQSREVLKGYQEIITLNPEERSKVQFFAVFAGAAISALHYLNTYIRQPDGSKQNEYKFDAQRTEHIFHLPQATFNKILAKS